MGKVFNTEEFIIAVFCCIEDWLHEIIQGQRIRAAGFEPKLSDSEVITMEIVGEFRGLDQDKAIWQYFRDRWLCLFPHLGSRSTFVRQAANLWNYKQLLNHKISRTLGGFTDDVHLVDGIPIPLCRITRAARCRLFTESAEYGYCAAKDENYYGFHGHLVINSQGVKARIYSYWCQRLRKSRLVGDYPKHFWIADWRQRLYFLGISSTIEGASDSTSNTFTL